MRELENNIPRQSGGESKCQWGNTGNGSQEAVAQAKRQRTEADSRQVPDALLAQDLTEGDEAVVLADHAVHVPAEDGAARHEGTQSAERAAGGDDRPTPGEAVDEAGDGGGRGVAHDGRERGDEDHEEDEHPAGRHLAPRFGIGGQPGEEGVRVDDGEDAEDGGGHEADGGEQALQRRQAQVHLEGLLAEELGRGDDATDEGAGAMARGASEWVGQATAGSGGR